MKFEAKNLSPIAFHALTCAEVSVSIQCFDWSKMAAKGFPVARIDEYAPPYEPAIHVLRSVVHFKLYPINVNGARYTRARIQINAEVDFRIWICVKFSTMRK